MSRTGVKRVLVLDQDPDFLNQLSQGFSNEPYELLLATTVDQGLRLLGEAHPDLLVVDSSLQPALQATLRANSRTGLPPILVTLQGHDPEEEAVLEAFERGGTQSGRRGLPRSARSSLSPGERRENARCKGHASA